MKEYRVKVRQWLTRTAEKPIPCREMIGRIERETAKAYLLELRGFLAPSTTCLHCGRELTHPVSLLYGLGPVCGGHFHINPLGSEAELKARYAEMQQKMGEVRWKGWVPKSGIEQMREVVGNLLERYGVTV
jgi:hypothetical protein